MRFPIQSTLKSSSLSAASPAQPQAVHPPVKTAESWMLLSAGASVRVLLLFGELRLRRASRRTEGLFGSPHCLPPPLRPAEALSAAQHPISLLLVGEGGPYILERSGSARVGVPAHADTVRTLCSQGFQGWNKFNFFFLIIYLIFSNIYILAKMYRAKWSK